MCDFINETVCLSGNVSSDEEVPTFEHAFLFLLLIFFSLVTILGNLLVIFLVLNFEGKLGEGAGRGVDYKYVHRCHSIVTCK